MRLVMGNSYGQEAEAIILDKYSKRAGSQVGFSKTLGFAHDSVHGQK